MGVFALTCLIFTLTWQASSPTMNEDSLLTPPSGIKFMTFGFHEIVADILWLRAIQGFDNCKKVKLCRGHSWLFSMVDAVTDLSPQFRTAYLSGALALGVLANDDEGASKLYDKAAVAFPDDWKILYYAGYHFMYEAKDPKKAASYLVRAGEHGAPPWVFSLAGRLYAESGNPNLARELLQKMIQDERDPALIKRMREKIESLDSH